jgi:hypothetical protein
MRCMIDRLCNIGDTWFVTVAVHVFYVSILDICTSENPAETTPTPSQTLDSLITSQRIDDSYVKSMDPTSQQAHGLGL